jgi:hypothetical protein
LAVLAWSDPRVSSPRSAHRFCPEQGQRIEGGVMGKEAGEFGYPGGVKNPGVEENPSEETSSEEEITPVEESIITPPLEEAGE